MLGLSRTETWRHKVPVTLEILVCCLSPLQIRKIAVFRFLISLLVPVLLKVKDLKNDQKMIQRTARFLIKTIKIDSICDVMSWTSGSKQYLNLLKSLHFILAQSGTS